MRINWLFFPTVVIAALMFYIGVYAETNIPSKAGRRFFHVVAVVASLPALAYVVYYFHLFDRMSWFYEFRAMPYTELLASGLGLAAGPVYVLFNGENLGEKLVVPIAALVVLFAPYMKPVLAPLDWKSLSNKCDGDACLQSTPSTCGPTSAVNVLRLFGRVGSERELARESLTYRGGTENWYLVRALRRRGMRVDVVANGDLGTIGIPVIAGVILKGGAGHFIAVTERSGDKFTIVDPLIGKMTVSANELNSRYRFTGFFMVVSDSSRSGLMRNSATIGK